MAFSNQYQTANYWIGVSQNSPLVEMYILKNGTTQRVQGFNVTALNNNGDYDVVNKFNELLSKINDLETALANQANADSSFTINAIMPT